jgi:proteasome lid subunit RPN8/RPN11
VVLRSCHRYVAEASLREGRRLGELALGPDLGPAAEWSHLEGVRRGALPALAHHGPGVVEPVFDEADGPPYVAGIRVRFDAADPAYEAPVVPWDYFHHWVEASAARLVHDGTLEANASFVYRICAFPRQGSDAPGTAPADRADQACLPCAPPAPLALGRAALAPRRAQAGRACQAAWDDHDFPVFVHAAVLDEAAEMARAAGERETGGILVGHLHRDTESTEIHAEITAQIPATEARAGRARLEFTAETWSAVSDALALRRRGELWLGWWHSHPYFCQRCDPAQRRRCALSRPFFSREDCELHRSVFDTAFSVALLLTDVGEARLRRDWFGWRHGAIAARGCYLLSPGTAASPAPHTAGSAAPAARVLSLNEEDHEH